LSDIVIKSRVSLIKRLHLFGISNLLLYGKLKLILTY
jgi:hypothetical protein